MTNDKYNMDIGYYNIFMTFIKCVKSNDDRIHIYNIYSSKIKDNKIKILMKGFVNTNNNNYCIGVREFINLISKFNKFKYRDDVHELVSYIFKRTVDQIQRNTVIKIIGYMSPKKLNVENKIISVNGNNYIEKACPHCNKKVKSTKNTTYIICGYSDTGFDWEGCGRDWCFRCGLKLCKSWYVNELFVHNNRFHDDKCCKLCAYKNNENYKDTYCKCKKIYVNHRI